MGILDKIMDFEGQPLSQITYNMVKWFDFDCVDISTSYRADVESRVWISIKIIKKESTWYVDGQRIDIVKRRLIEFLNKELTK